VANLKADRIEVTRDEQQNKWLIRIWVGDEVIRRYCHEAADVDRTTLTNAAIKTAYDEGYTIDPLNVVFP
jgi:hypothetical protein